MANVREIRERLEALLSQRISLDDFEDWFAPYTWNIHKNSDEDAQQLAYAIEHQLSQYEDDCDALRIELTRLLGASAGEHRSGNPVDTSRGVEASSLPQHLN
jgi:hypothetical protein